MNFGQDEQGTSPEPRSWREILASIDSQYFRGYGRKPLPDPSDDVVRQFLRAFAEATPATRASMVAAVTRPHRATLLAFAERMASYAVRTESMDALREAALAYALPSGVGDERDALLVLSLLHDASVRLKQPPEQLFQWAGSQVSNGADRIFAAFLRRQDHDKRIGAMGYFAGADAGGFRYLRNW